MPPEVPGLVTVTVAVPAVARSASGTVAVTWLPLTKAVGRAVPFQLIVALLLNRAPVTISPLGPNEVPAVVVLGTRETMLGMVPTAGGVLFFALYPQAEPKASSRVRKIVFVSFMFFSLRGSTDPA